MTCPVCNGNEFLGEGATFSNEGGPADDPPPKCTNCDGSGLAPGIILKNGDVARTGDTLESKGVKYLLEFYKFDSSSYQISVKNLDTDKYVKLPGDNITPTSTKINLHPLFLHARILSRKLQ